ncbi:MAG: xanthine dehydrogenase family protein molybdopterin-binding subunit [Bacteroidetes bacterium]|nr:xanthine dehydrogenase family protein molybdopterin-binding subunit [Bacteroidota bacterium]
MNEIIGKPMDRVDGRLKVTGAATYSAEFNLKNLAYGVTVQSTIAKGRIRNIDSSEAEKLPGVLKVITHGNAIRLQAPGNASDPGSGKLGEKDLLPLQNDIIYYDGQHIAIVVAETFETAEHAASLIKVEYEEEKPALSIEQNIGSAYLPQKGLGGQNVQNKRGDAAAALPQSPVHIEYTYTTPVYHHNPMEPHATIAEWKNDHLTVYDATQSVLGSRNAIAKLLSMPPENVRLISLFLGGGFGCKGFTWAHSIMAPMAAKLVDRPVKIVINRKQMFTVNGRRSRTIQKIALGASNTGRLQAVQHEATTETSFVDEFIEPACVATPMLYETPNLEVVQRLVKLNRGTPCPTRAPGEAVGTFALEVAMDELAYALNMDPVQLRMANYTKKDPKTGKPFSAKYLDECYKKGAAAIGWEKRPAKPGTLREGDWLVGYGMATATYPANRSSSSARVQLFSNGTAEIACCTQDIGTGTYTILTQIAAEGLGLAPERVTCKLGDSLLPKGPNSGGSQTAATAGSAAWAAAMTLRGKAIKLATGDKESPLHGVPEASVKAGDGRLYVADNPAKGETYIQLLSRQRLPVLEAEVTTNVSTREGQKPPAGPKKDEQSEAVTADEQVDRTQYAFHSFGAQYARVLVDPLLGIVRVTHCTGVMDIDTVLNHKTATNQIMGGMIFGVGMALMEQTVYDPNDGRIVTRDLADYLLPVNADMPEFDIQFINKPDTWISPVGARGIGEIGITGITAAIINAIYNATGKRIRDLPATPDKLML